MNKYHDVLLQDVKARLINTNHDVSDTGEYCYKNKKYPIAIMWSYRCSKIVISLRSATIDVGKIDDKYFINVVSFGIDAQLVQHIPELKKKYRFFPGQGMYLYALLKQLSFPLDYPKIWIRFQEVGIPRTFGQQTTTLVISNGTQYGGGFKIAPQAILDDGFLDICWIKKMSRVKILKSLPKLIRGTHLNLPEVQIYRLQSLTVHPETKVACQVDGEPLDFKDKYCIKVVPKALNVVVPQKQGPQIIELERFKARVPMLQPA